MAICFAVPFYIEHLFFRALFGRLLMRETCEVSGLPWRMAVAGQGDVLRVPCAEVSGGMSTIREEEEGRRGDAVEFGAAARNFRAVAWY